MLAYLSRYTHRVAISSRRLVAMDERGVTLRWKDYRAKGFLRGRSNAGRRPSAHQFKPVAAAGIGQPLTPGKLVMNGSLQTGP